MSRVKQDVVDQVRELIALLPIEAKSKCALCNETLTHIVKQIEVQANAPMRTVCRELADQINETAAPGDRVSVDALQDRVRTKEDGWRPAKMADCQHNSAPTYTTQSDPTSPRMTPGTSPPQHPEPEPEPDYPTFDPALDIDRNGQPLQPRTKEQHHQEYKYLEPIMTHIVDPIKALTSCSISPDDLFSRTPDYLLRGFVGIDEAVLFLTSIQQLYHQRAAA